MQRIIGKVAFTPKGEHNINTSYEKLDTVTANNAMFIALKNVPEGTAITNTEYWQRTIDGMGGGSGIVIDEAMSDTSTNPVQNKVIKSYVDTAASGKVDKVTGKTLTSNDFTDALKNKLDGVAEGATANAGTITGVTMNGESRGTSGVVDLGTVLTEHQDISGKVDKVTGKGLSTNDFTDTLKNTYDGYSTTISNKVDKVSGKGLSTNDYTTTEKNNLASIISKFTMSSYFSNLKLTNDYVTGRCFSFSVDVTDAGRSAGGQLSGVTKFSLNFTNSGITLEQLKNGTWSTLWSNH